MTELQEITDGKTFEQLLIELKHQISQGESKGGAIVNHVLYECQKAATTHEQRNEIDAVMKG